MSSHRMSVDNYVYKSEKKVLVANTMGCGCCGGNYTISKISGIDDEIKELEEAIEWLKEVKADMERQP